MKQKQYVLVSGVLILSFFLYPKAVNAAAQEGLLLWFQTVIPALLPFLILSSVMLGMGIDDGICRAVAPIFTRFFGISPAGCYPVVIGMLSGYPLGAATVAEMVKREKISRSEAQYILHFCNNASPMFLLQYIGVHCMGLRYPFLVIVLIYLAAWTNAGWERCMGRFRRGKKSAPVLHVCQRQPFIALLDESILHGFTVLAKVGGYIILFSILAELLEQTLPLPIQARAVLTGILEITTGAEQIANMPGSEALHMVLLAGCGAFGGFSSAAQSASVLDQTGLSVQRYILAKFRQALLAAAYMAAVISLFGIDMLH